ncbi:MAG TPA: IS66 family insertion sequence element accessory protein TnpB [Candidatus Caccosoma faecigallinarum]|uniref:IS66 family insertion sequence element accessory protein TnpB n=1 Tax=Candidatus Caccosoma faecigallinarum TaxID=2840720 RepID=A0A9D1G8C3_9FIRM|nr:IS66 family insertion sequence element accessory protein TnpB [Candidatus Caccosoma faecigallinarum]
MKGITDFRCGINRLSEIIRDKQTVNVFDNAAFIFICKNKQGGVASASLWLFFAILKQ